jgi:hypothetical protein
VVDGRKEASDNKGSFLVKMQWGREDYKCWVEPADPERKSCSLSLCFLGILLEEKIYGKVVVANCERRRDDANKDEVVGLV